MALAGCTASSGPDPASELTVFPAIAYTGVDDGGIKYVVPIGARGPSTVAWTAADDTIAWLDGTASETTAHALKPGTTTVTARSGERLAQAKLVVAAYTAAQRTAGEHDFATFGCASCHAPTASNITPSGIARHTDDQILAAVTAGANPEGGDISIGRAAHSFAAGPGIVVYLRSLAPVGPPEADE